MPIITDHRRDNLVICPDCFSRVSPNANSCPVCGRAMKASVGRIIGKVIFWFVVIIGTVAIVERLLS